MMLKGLVPKELHGAESRGVCLAYVSAHHMCCSRLLLVDPQGMDPI